MFYPKEEFGSTYQIPFDEFYKKGYRAVVFDIDNTLVPHGAPADARSIRLCEYLRTVGFQICLLSNNSAKRVAPFAEAVRSQYISRAGKPFKKGYQEAADLLQVPTAKILFVGDQILTDIIGANRVGYYSILVGPIGEKETFFIMLKRFMERITVAMYRRSSHYKGTRPDRKGYHNNIPEQYR